MTICHIPYLYQSPLRPTNEVRQAKGASRWKYGDWSPSNTEESNWTCLLIAFIWRNKQSPAAQRVITFYRFQIWLIWLLRNLILLPRTGYKSIFFTSKNRKVFTHAISLKGHKDLWLQYVFYWHSIPVIWPMIVLNLWRYSIMFACNNNYTFRKILLPHFQITGFALICKSDFCFF